MQSAVPVPQLLLTKPETVIAVVLRGEAASAPDQQETPSEAPAPQRRARRPSAAHVISFIHAGPQTE
jgi:hypothetical protein